MADLVEIVARAIEGVIDNHPAVDASPSRIREIRANSIASCALTALRSAGALREWRPIEEAPVDGTWLLVSDGANVWLSGKKEPTVRSRDGMPVDGQDWYIGPGRSSPTHFMPLPPPPEEGSMEDELNAAAEAYISGMSGGAQTPPEEG